MLEEITKISSNRSFSALSAQALQLKEIWLGEKDEVVIPAEVLTYPQKGNLASATGKNGSGLNFKYS